MARFEVLPKSRALLYLTRAQEFAEQMDRAASAGAWNSVGLLGVHCVISACDSLTVAVSGQRWSGQDHAGVYGVIRSLKLPGAETALRQIAEVLESKNRVEYEARAYTEREAEELRRSARRVLSWVVRHHSK
ncbi:MAG: HEPN domain-containing protein [Thermoplasmata archaeon]